MSHAGTPSGTYLAATATSTGTHANTDTATGSDREAQVHKRRIPYELATNPHGFRPATLARLRELLPEARENEI